jgi:Family of unknown function (DUF5675)
MTLRSVVLQRFFKNDKQTLGVWTLIGPELFVAKTLELPYRDNKPDISCIPPNTYICKWTRSNRLSAKSIEKWLKENPGKKETDAPDDVRNVYTYEVFNVPGRSGIRVHTFNFYFQGLGCIAVGDAHKDINADGELDVVHSGKTIADFAKILNYEDFMLSIF